MQGVYYFACYHHNENESKKNYKFSNSLLAWHLALSANFETQDHYVAFVVYYKCAYNQHPGCHMTLNW